MRIYALAPVAFGCLLSACAGGVPLLHPAHTLSPGRTRFGAGTSANFALGQASEAIDKAKAETLPAVVQKPSEAYTRGALAVAAFAPGLSPFVSGRVGLANNTEAGLSYSGRAIRIDGRYALQSESWALSMGAGGSALLSRREDSTSSTVSGLNLESVSGWGLDVPLLVGWRSEADLLWWWTGARGGYEQLRGTVSINQTEPQLPLDGDINAHRIYATGLMGLGLGFRYFHAALEVQGGYHHATGSLWGASTTVNGFTVAPSAALLGRF